MTAVPQINFTKHSHCSWCGAKFAEQKFFPRKCFICHNDTYVNPIPIVVALIPVWQNIGEAHQSGILVGKRAIEPKKDEWALPGGYLNVGESWQQGCAREVYEEVGLLTDPEGYQLFGVESATNGNILIFGAYRQGARFNNIKFIPNEECSQIDLVYGKTELAFPTHTQAVDRWYSEL